MKKGIVTREVILLLIAVITLVSMLLVIMYLNDRGVNILDAIRDIFTFQ